MQLPPHEDTAQDPGPSWHCAGAAHFVKCENGQREEDDVNDNKLAGDLTPGDHTRYQEWKFPVFISCQGLSWMHAGCFGLLGQGLHPRAQWEQREGQLLHLLGQEHAGQVQGDATVISPREGLIIGLWRVKTSDGCRAEIVRCEETGYMVRVVEWEIEQWISHVSLKVTSSHRQESTMLYTEIRWDTIRYTPSKINININYPTDLSSDSISGSQHLPKLDVIFGQLVRSCSLGFVGLGS